MSTQDYLIHLIYIAMKENKLIAEFMGYEVKHNKCYSPKHNDGTIAPMQFDTSWDWLMPVLVKIERLEVGDVTWTSVYFDRQREYDKAVEFIKDQACHIELQEWEKSNQEENNDELILRILFRDFPRVSNQIMDYIDETKGN